MNIQFTRQPSLFRLLFVFAVFTFFNLTTVSGQLVPNGSSNAKIGSFVDSILVKMTLEEKLGQLNQYRWVWGENEEPIRQQYREYIKEGKIGSFLGIFGVESTRELQRIAVEESRLGIPLLLAFDVIHGFRTIFPVPLAESASWEPANAEKSARIAAIEAAASGLHWTFAPMVDITHDPRWGRIIEGAGEDPYLGSQMAAARVRGFQGQDLAASNTVLACAKHFVAYGAAEGGRDYNTADISERSLREIYLPPFQSVINSDVATVMASFNEIGGVPMHANGWLINDVMRREWGFNGLVISDFTGVMELLHHGIAADSTQAGINAISAGVDIDMVSNIYLTKLKQAIEKKELPIAIVDEAVRRVLKLKYRAGLFEDPYRYQDTNREKQLLLHSDHLKASREVARQSIVLLKNENQILPLNNNIQSIAVIGALATDGRSSLGSWHGAGRSEEAITVLQGIRDALPGCAIKFAEGYTTPQSQDKTRFAKAVEIAQQSEAVILVLGESGAMSGEASNRSTLDLPGVQQDLAQEIHKTGKPLVVVLMNGRPLSINWLDQNVPAILETWFLGSQMGHAVADVLVGHYNPGGKLPVTFPRSVGQIPIYYNHKNTGRPPDKDIVWTSKYIDIDWTPLYPFGYGLSYTTFAYKNLNLNKNQMVKTDTLDVSVEVHNTGKVDGDEVVQLYIQDEVGSVTRPVKQLRNFKRIHLRAGEMKRVSFKISAEDLQFYNIAMKNVVEPGFFKVYVGGNSVDLLEKRFELVATK
ncbi:MAG: beta-glucosidase BglX [Deferribacteres bacterium]|nr:beta-glucosidase BglX [candidate division KSB1 bacterium]MCB9501451.1 beta-glucosidase BglX [Deferribacteres bacterium]